MISIEVYIPASLDDGMVWTRNRTVTWGMPRYFAFFPMKRL